MPYEGSLCQEVTQEYLKGCPIKGPYINNLHKNILKSALWRLLISIIYTRLFKKVPFEASLCQEVTQEYLKGCPMKGPYIKNLHKNI